MKEYLYNKEELMSLAAERKYALLRERLTHLTEVDTADLINSLPAEQQMVVFSLTEKEVAADVFAELPVESQESLVNSLNDQQLTTIISDLAVDDMVDLVGDLPAVMVKRILQHTKPETRELVNKFLRFPEHSVGSIMTPQFISLKKEMTVKDAIAKIKRLAANMETIYTVYVTDMQRHLEGIVGFKSLLLADEDAMVSTLMERDVISIKTTDDQETASTLLNKYNFLSLPVVDAENCLVGIVTVDDAVDVMQDEATEDFQKMAAIQPSEKPYLKTGVFEMTGHRIIWLAVLMIADMFTGLILGKYEDAFVAVPLLVTFMPMITDTGGNAGSQSSTLVIRGMAIGDLHLRDWLKIFWKELRVSVIIGIALAAICFVRIQFMMPGDNLHIAIVVSLSMIATVMLAKTIGGILPVFAKLIHTDPAVMAGPLITTIVDAMSLIIYFNIARLFLKL
jgi:magnesium transporter